MSHMEALKKQFLNPPAEFSPIPFWFWNDELTEEEIIRQINEFHEKEVDGFVLHPRMGLPRSMPYLSDGYMELVEAAVAEAERLGMRVILYDEGMYPSGSANGMVVKRNPDYASRGLQLREIACPPGGGSIALSLQPGETLVSAQAVRKRSEREVDAGGAILLDVADGAISFAPPKEGDWSLLLFVDTYSKGTIRGVHPGQDDGEPDVPAAADLLNPAAVQAFIALTHERYYAKLSRYFGKTVFAMFTDEPDLLGRGHVKGLKPWTSGLLDEFVAAGGREQDLALLWFEEGQAEAEVRERFAAVVRQRLARTYYQPLADWCEAHGIGLTGHPAASDDIGLLTPFHIPGQDVVWRYIAPEDGKGLTGAHSTMGKCSSDSARHRGKRRNLNEAFGVCGIEGGWTLTADNMKWYLDWLFVRGVNLISPHAFYYSIRGERRDERPPDVGPNNIWWPEYKTISRYIKRMSWLMTGSVNSAKVAVLAGGDYLPWRIVKPLYERQIEFNYLEESLLQHACQVKDGLIEIAGYRYSAVLIQEGSRFAPGSWETLEAFVRQGGLIIEWNGRDEDGSANSIGQIRDIGQICVQQEQQAAEELERRLDRDYSLNPSCADIRISRVEKNGMLFYVIVNEGEEGYSGALRMKHTGLTEVWNPWTGSCDAASAIGTIDGQNVILSLERRASLVIAVQPNDWSEQEHDDWKRIERGHELEEGSTGAFEAAIEFKDLSAGWRVVEGPWTGELKALASWTEWAGLEHFSGTVVYETSFEWSPAAEWTSIKLDLGIVHELARVWVNGREVGVQMWSPYMFAIGQELQQGMNVLRVAVTNSLTNQYDGKSWPSGLIGPVRLLGMRHETVSESII
ncbi:glycosylhydrolase-like jelly roll fold domain-containing protein [Paenibacillus sp. HB172176]|uniref:glycosylhydrolase-like jelly roll fold domain-containing protein n=1 Tax=Paenibacillus sp. HB172176 TaxID=2493690 RepID=UPI00197FC42D|nr:glycosylhydrolase-like jelly roll fold domain-containing protein [Paenibacillus sp. HB172176]